MHLYYRNLSSSSLSHKKISVLNSAESPSRMAQSCDAAAVCVALSLSKPPSIKHLPGILNKLKKKEHRLLQALLFKLFAPWKFSLQV